MKKRNYLIAAVFIIPGTIICQNIGVQTTSPAAPFHIWSSGQVNTIGGLVLLGDTTEGHLEVDYDRIQSLIGQGGNTLPLRLQPAGGNLGVNIAFPNNPQYALDVNGTVGINDRIYHNGDAGNADTYLELLDDRVKIVTGAHTLIDIDTLNLAIGNTSNTNINISDGDIYVKGSNGFVGFGDLTPNATVNINAGAADAPFRIQQDGNTRMFVFTTGEIGMGTGGYFNPAANVHVKGVGLEDAFRVEQDGNAAFFVHNTGDIGISKTSFFDPVTTLHIKHDNSGLLENGLSIENTVSKRWHFVVDSVNNLLLYGDGTLHGMFVWGSGDYVPLSDIREKKEITDIPSMLDKLMVLRPKAYQMIADDSGDEQYGFIAQDVKEVIPENVRYDAQLDRYVVLYKGMSVIAIKAIQEQQLLIDKLQKENEQIKSRLERLERLVLLDKKK